MPQTGPFRPGLDPSPLPPEVRRAPSLDHSLRAGTSSEAPHGADGQMLVNQLKTCDLAGSRCVYND